MESELSPAAIRNIIENIKYPVVFKNSCTWNVLRWSLEDWVTEMGDRELPFRCQPRESSREPCWERKCRRKFLTFEKFLSIANSGEKEWLYFDYKYFQEWFKTDNKIKKELSWAALGYPEVDVSESTLWIGSRGAHTPCHQDTYGRNIVVQVYGRKQWILYPPDAEGLLPTRVPYEESSIYSQINFSSPCLNNVPNGARMVTLDPGDILILPRHWWHHVEHVSPLAITINTWIPCEELDAETRVEEALTRLLVSQICKDLPEEQTRDLLNPNEDGFPDTPMSVNIQNVEKAVQLCLQQRRNQTGCKKFKKIQPECNTEQGTSTKHIEIKNIDEIIKEHSFISCVEELTEAELLTVIKEKVNRFQDDADKKTDNPSEASSNLNAAIINAFCCPETISTAKNNLLRQYNA